MDTRALLVSLACVVGRLLAQEPCANTPAYSPCDLVFELSEADAKAHPNPYVSVELHAEFRSPRHRTFLMPAFWDGGRRLVLRFTPTEPGPWDYRVTSNVAAWEGRTGAFTAAASDSPGFIRPANVHHWSYTEEQKPHLWMGDTSLRFASMDSALFQRLADVRASQKFNHLRGLVLGGEANQVFPAPDRLNPAYFQQLDERVRYLNRKGLIADLILANDPDQLAQLFPDWQARQHFVGYIVSRYAPFHITWQGVRQFEHSAGGRELLKEIGTLLKQQDPYQHPRTSGCLATSAPLLEDGWMNFVAEHSSQDAVGAIEHQLYAVPFVNLRFGFENSGAGKAAPDDVAIDEFRHRLWNAAMNGQYVTFGNTGTAGDRLPVDARFLDSPGARQMTVCYDFFAGTRHWELEPYFDVDGGRALALEGVEYIVYVERPGPVELLVEKHGYDVAWINPASGERLKEKNFKGERFTGEPPDKTHDWVLHVSREGHKEGMLRSYKFESRLIAMQEIEQNTPKVPFVIEQPAENTISISKPPACSAHIQRETRATRSMLWLWTGEVAADGQGYRVLGAGPKGTLHIPAGMARNFPAVLNLRLFGMNANGKVYSVDKIYQLTR